MGYDPEYKAAFNYLVNKGIAITSPDDPNRFWAHDLSTLKGIRWAHNTTLKAINTIIDTAIKTGRHPILIAMGIQTKHFFNEIPDQSNRELWISWMESHTKWKIIATASRSDK